MPNKSSTRFTVPQDPIPRIKCPLFKVEVNPTSIEYLENLLKTTNSLQSARRSRILVGHNLHSVFLYHSDPLFRKLYDNSWLVICDGKPIQLEANFVARRTHIPSYARPDRIGSTDWIPAVLRDGAFHRIAVVGASMDSNRDFVAFVRRLSPSAQAIGIPGNNWNEETSKLVISTLASFSPDLVLVGLGMPLQEHFLAENLTRLPRALYAAVGGAIDQLSGHQTLAPRWLGTMNLEWFWRLAHDPRRLSTRYLVEPWKLFVLLSRLQIRAIGERSKHKT